ncbi:hypothetical protein DL240_01130 [Lujinxingia litoralis]|uniref:NFACT RNA-binding domain-containing protein n=1 Tax=Lujinxingia litoralis TaxID=2211119 RepID=A0A328CDP7_9DELT|nr:NFACT RNA binding domain-containing protein [Lujinxingia litoralis]RAL24843.1 hypothetical protein DL240_01130 [Lujinxingia litoralis]
MNLSHADLQLIVDEIRTLAVPGVIQKVFDAGPRRAILQVRSPGHTYNILVSVAPEDTRLHLVAERPRVSGPPQAFVMQLRKWLHGAWIQAIDLDARDRIITFTLSAIDPTWEPQPDDERALRREISLVCELVGHHPNVFVVDQERIVGMAHGRSLGERDLRPGAHYNAPPPPPERGPQAHPELVAREGDGSRSTWLSAHIDDTLAQQHRTDLYRRLQSDLRSRARTLRRRLKNIEEDLGRIEASARYQIFGELLQSAYGRVKRGATQVRVPDYYQEGMPEISIPLDPAHDLQWNIDRYFHQHRRYKEARDDVETRFLQSEEALEEVEDARQTLQELSDADLHQLQAFEQELRASQLLKRTRRQRAARRAHAPRPPYREFRSHKGAVILVGRGAKHNDALTTRVARGRDLWLHARDWSGAHVIVRRERDQTLDSETLIDAATLAAHFSRGRKDSLIDVTYTDARHVRKPRGSAPGMVTIASGATIAVTLEEDRLERLLATEIDPGD